MSIFEDELEAFEKLEKAFEQSVKAPEVIGIPQERITGDILRGRGPRRGNQEDLLKYWRPIMKKPGGFRRCVVILADKPKLYPPQRICAWLHHEQKWLYSIALQDMVSGPLMRPGSDRQSMG